MMIDGWNAFTNALWIVGLALALAVFSYADWRATSRQAGLRAAVRDTLCFPAFLSGLALGCLGAGLGVTSWWERIAWLALACGFAAIAGWAYASGRRKPSP